MLVFLKSYRLLSPDYQESERHASTILITPLDI